MLRLLFLVAGAAATTSVEYPKINGWGNNKGNVKWGTKNQPLLETAFDQAVQQGSSPPDFDGLASPRVISNLLGDTISSFHPGNGLSGIPVSFGQAVGHDLAFTANGEWNFPIAVPQCDFYFDKQLDGGCTGIETLPFKRFLRDVDNCDPPEGNTGTCAKQKGNQFLQASWIYGYNDNSGAEVRKKLPDGSFSALLELDEDDGFPDAPGQIGNDAPNNFAVNCPFLAAGDPRLNENIGMSTIFLVFAREHNTQVEILRAEWANSDLVVLEDTLFNEVRIQIIAIMQKIAYEEYFAEVLALNPLEEGRAPATYEPNTNPGVQEMFTVAAYRYGHASIPSQYIVAPVEENSRADYLAARDANMNSCPVQNNFDGVLIGQLFTPMGDVSIKYPTDMRNHLVTGKRDRSPEQDLLALDIQRGRDAGLPSFNNARRWLGLDPYNSLDDFIEDGETKKALIKLYGEEPMERMDLLVGGFLEKKERWFKEKYPGSSEMVKTSGAGSLHVGPTFAEIMREQMWRTAAGDRFFYTWKNLKISPESNKRIKNYLEDRDMLRIIKENTNFQKSHFNWPSGSAFRLHSLDEYQTDGCPDFPTCSNANVFCHSKTGVTPEGYMNFKCHSGSSYGGYECTSADLKMSCIGKVTINSCEQKPVVLGKALNFAVLARTTVTNTGVSHITGDLGVFPGTAVTGIDLESMMLKESAIYVGDKISAAGIADLTAAYSEVAGRVMEVATNKCEIPKIGDLGGITLAPGFYVSTSSLEISSGDLMLDAGFDGAAVWIFQMASTFTLEASKKILLVNGAKASNVFWHVGTSGTLGPGSIFVGTMMADQSISVGTGAFVDGAVLARMGAVTLQANTISLPDRGNYASSVQGAERTVETREAASSSSTGYSRQLVTALCVIGGAGWLIAIVSVVAAIKNRSSRSCVENRVSEDKPVAVLRVKSDLMFGTHPSSA